jgi:hypothetical protein
MQVNKQLAARLLAQQEEEAAAAAAAADGGAAPGPPAKRRKGDLGVNPMADDRFKAMFEDEEFAIDEQSAEYRLLHPNAAKVCVLGWGGVWGCCGAGAVPGCWRCIRTLLGPKHVWVIMQLVCVPVVVAACAQQHLLGDAVPSLVPAATCC